MKTTVNLAASILAIVFVSIYTLGLTSCSKETNVTPANIQKQAASMQSDQQMAFTSSGRFEYFIRPFFSLAQIMVSGKIYFLRELFMRRFM